MAMVVIIEWLETLSDDTGPTVPECLARVDTIGDLDEWWQARIHRDHDLMLVQEAKNKAAAVEWQRKALSDEDARLLAEVDALLAAHAQGSEP